eukprot:m.11122 g.11122  ORF g.11122 m.11122 type:complete len:349 (+) comp3131_c0_seq1:674-1720(+)
MCGGNSDAKIRSQAIDRALRKQAKVTAREMKLLLLGTGESGKSTLIKQMQIIYGKGFDEDDRRGFTVLVYRNILQSMKNMLDALDRFHMTLEDKSLESRAYDLLDIPVASFSEMNQVKDIIASLWADGAIKKVYAKRNLYQLSDSTKYYLNDLARITTPGYIPTVQDVLRARMPTTGIHEFMFDLEQVVFRMLDVGGQRSERRKWIHCFQDVTAVIFIAAASEFDQVLVEEDSVNRMAESVALFDHIINYPVFDRASFILFLNKDDILEEKVAAGSHIEDYFEGYEGKRGDLEDTRNFITRLYLERKPDAKDVYYRFTKATDTENIKFVFGVVRSHLLRANMRSFNIM